MSIICDICNKATGSVYPGLIAEIREKKIKDNDNTMADIFPLEEKSKMAHIECCSTDQIEQILLSQAQDQIAFYKDVIDLIKDEKQQKEKKDEKTILDKMDNFERKNGSFDEIRQGTNIDDNLLTFALIAELKRKNQTI